MALLKFEWCHVILCCGAQRPRQLESLVKEGYYLGELRAAGFDIVSMLSNRDFSPEGCEAWACLARGLGAALVQENRSCDLDNGGVIR